MSGTLLGIWAHPDDEALVGHDVHCQWWRTESFVNALTDRHLYDHELKGTTP